MASGPELDFETSTSFWESEDGRNLYQFAQSVYSKMPEGTVINLTSTSDFLAFSEPTLGISFIRNLVESQLLILAHPKPPVLTRRELLVAQLAKVRFAPSEQLYSEVLDKLHQQLSGSGLEQHLGETLKPGFRYKSASVSLEFHQEPWWCDPISLKANRIIRAAS